MTHRALSISWASIAPLQRPLPLDRDKRLDAHAMDFSEADAPPISSTTPSLRRPTGPSTTRPAMSCTKASGKPAPKAFVRVSGTIMALAASPTDVFVQVGLTITKRGEPSTARPRLPSVARRVRPQQEAS